MTNERDRFYKTYGVMGTPGGDDLLKKLFQKPKKQINKNRSKFPTTKTEPGFIHMADLLFLPNDRGHRYALVVTDMGSGKTDAEPLKTKSADAVKRAFERIYSRGILSLPKFAMYVDDGTEFKSDAARYFKNKGIVIRVASVGRHSQQSLIERRNLRIGNAITMRQNAEELKTGNISRTWVRHLKKIIELINSKLPKRKIKKNNKLEEILIEDGTKLLDKGTRVRVALDTPRDIRGKRLHGNFRSNDMRFSKEPTRIKRVLLSPGQPPQYIVQGKPNTPYVREQLQVVTGKETLPPDFVVDGPEADPEPKEQKQKTKATIIGRRIKNDNILYDIEIDGKKSLIPHRQMLEDYPGLVRAYERNRRARRNQ